jgi:hypothetical protein
MNAPRPSTHRRRPLLRAVAIATLLLAVPAYLTSNPLLTLAGMAVVPILFALLWRPNEPPVLLFAASFQWIQVFMPVLNADRRDEVLTSSIWLREIDSAAWLGLLTIVVLAIGMRVGLGRRPIADPEELDVATRNLDVRRLAFAYVASFVIPQVVLVASAFVPGLTQQLLALTVLRWAVIFLIGWAALRFAAYRPLAVAVLTIEILLGFTGYFSTFKTILFLAMILIAATGVGLRRLMRPSLIVVMSAAIVLMSFWQWIKQDYRFFVSEGQRAQVVLVPMASRFGFLMDRVSDVTFDDLRTGLEEGLDRLGYLEFFARTLEFVPARVPHQHGRLWGEALRHVAMPRLLFPGKPAVNDSERTREFTGWWVASVEEGTSISIGYAAESYIDFGRFGMFVPIFLLGCFWGWAFRWLAGRARNKLLGVAVSTNLILSGAIYFEASNVKLFGGAVSSLLVLWILLRYGGDAIWRFVAPRPAEPLLVMPVPTSAAPSAVASS